MLHWQHQNLLISHFSSFHFRQKWQFWLNFPFVPFGRMSAVQKYLALVSTLIWYHHTVSTDLASRLESLDLEESRSSKIYPLHMYMH